MLHKIMVKNMSHNIMVKNYLMSMFLVFTIKTSVGSGCSCQSEEGGFTIKISMDKTTYSQLHHKYMHHIIIKLITNFIVDGKIISFRCI